MPTKNIQKQGQLLSKSQKFQLIIEKAVEKAIEKHLPDMLFQVLEQFFPEEAENNIKIENLQEALFSIQNQIASITDPSGINSSKRRASSFDRIQQASYNNSSKSKLTSDEIKKKYGNRVNKNLYGNLNTPQGEDLLNEDDQIENPNLKRIVEQKLIQARELEEQRKQLGLNVSNEYSVEGFDPYDAIADTEVTSSIMNDNLYSESSIPTMTGNIIMNDSMNPSNYERFTPSKEQAMIDPSELIPIIY